MGLALKLEPPGLKLEMGLDSEPLFDFRFVEPLGSHMIGLTKIYRFTFECGCLRHYHPRIGEGVNYRCQSCEDEHRRVMLHCVLADHDWRVVGGGSPRSYTYYECSRCPAFRTEGY